MPLLLIVWVPQILESIPCAIIFQSVGFSAQVSTSYEVLTHPRYFLSGMRDSSPDSSSGVDFVWRGVQKRARSYNHETTRTKKQRGDDTTRTDIQGLFEMSRRMRAMIETQQEAIDRLRLDVLELRHTVRVLKLNKGVIGQPSGLKD